MQGKLIQAIANYLAASQTTSDLAAADKYVKTEETKNKLVKQFMAANGFVNTKNHDYYNSVLGIILEDLHDQNVLTQDGNLYFIDTVFYVKHI
ncbi:MAG: hypothetical protein NTZ59_07255 [Bacteroidetes bacterium]|nr:hypothetical protein [Bacteroidota bacterium]